MGRIRSEATSRRQRMPAWWYSIALHGGVLGVVAFMMPVLIFRQDSFGPPLRVELRVEPTERVLPRWQSKAEMPPMPEVEMVFEPVQECRSTEEQKPAECAVTFTVMGDINPANAYPICAVGQMTRPRIVQPAAASMPVAAPVQGVPVEEPTKPAVAAVSTVGGPSRAACVLGALEPRYPERQRAAGRSATVLLLVHIDERGCPAEVQLLNDDVHPDFAKAAIAAARKAHYEPALAEGRPIPSEIRVRIQFQLQ